jgi:hypothetical protein
MPTPVFETIAVKLKQRLESISIANGYALTVDGVTRPIRLNNFEPANYHVRLTQGDTNINRTHTAFGNPVGMAWDIPFLIAGEIRPSEDLTTSIDEQRNEFWAEIVKAITTPNDTWHNFDGYALNTEMQDIRNYTEPDGGAAGFRFTLIVTTRVSELDPYVLRV